MVEAHGNFDIGYIDCYTKNNNVRGTTQQRR